VPGAASYTNSAHAGAVADGCVTCHMHGDIHSFEPSEDACIVCHADIDGFDYRDIQTEMEELMDELQAALIADGLLLEEDGETHPNDEAVTTHNKAGALFNYQGLVSDGSYGIHNTKYTRAILQNSIDLF